MSEQRAGAGKDVIIGVDYMDLIDTAFAKENKIFGEAEIRKLIRDFAACGINTVYWRVDYIGLVVYRSKVCTVPQRRNTQRPCFKIIRGLLKKFDPLEVVIDEGHRNGMKIFAYVTLFDDSYDFETKGWESDFGRNNRHFYSRHYSGSRSVQGVFSYGYPEVREYKLNQIAELLAYRPDGIYMDCARTHAGGNAIPVHGWYPQCTEPYLAYGYNDYEVEEYKKRYGEAPFVRTPTSLEGIEETEKERNWNRIRGEFVTMLIRDASRLVRADGKALSVGFYPRTYNGFQPGYQTRQMVGRIQLDWETWAKERLIDTIYLIADHRKFGYDDWQADSARIFKPAQEQGVKVVVHADISSKKIDKLENSPYPLPVLDRTQYFSLLEDYVHRMLRSSADGVHFYEAKDHDEELYGVLARALEKYENLSAQH